MGRNLDGRVCLYSLPEEISGRKIYIAYDSGHYISKVCKMFIYLMTKGQGNNEKLKKINLIIGPLLLLLCIVALPESVFATFQSRAAIGTVAWMAYWWVTGPVDYAVTAFLPIAVNAVLQITEMKDVISNYASETILLLLGASILTVSWQKSGLDKRIASVF